MSAVAEDHLFAPDAEVAIIGAVLAAAGVAPEQVPGLIEAVRPEDFGDPVHARLWAAAGRLHGADAVITPRALSDAMGEDPGFQNWGGYNQLYDFWNVGTIFGAFDSAQTVHDRAVRRRLATLSETIRSTIRNTATPAFDQVAAVERDVAGLLNTEAPAEVNLIDARSAALAVMDEIEEEARHGRPRGLMTGLRCFDYRMRGLRPGWLVVLAGRPSMGKTALARSAAMATAFKNPERLVVFFALEMDRRELTDRTLSELSHLKGDGIPYKDMTGDALDHEERARLRQVARLVPTNLIVDDSPVLSIDHVRRRLYALKRKGILGAVFIDYLQIMQRPPAHGRNEASVIGEMTQALKQLARELNVCIVLLSQINRGVESREDKRPQLSDLRESGAIEQDANAVLFCFRPVYYLERREPGASDLTAHRQWVTDCENERRKMDVLAPKVRGGAAGVDHQVYFAEFDHIEDGAPA